MADNKDKRVLKSSIEREQNQTCLNSAEREKIKGSMNLNVPHLRFPEFSGEWEETTLGKISEITKGSGISKDQLSEQGSPCILYGELYTKYKSEIIGEVYSRTELDSSSLVKSKANDVIIPCSGETAIDISTARCVPFNNILLGGDLNIIRLKNDDGGFFAYQLNGVRKTDIARVAQGVSVVHLYGENLKQIIVYHPAIEEQKKITRLLSLIDERIATQNKIIEDLKLLKSAISDAMFCTPKQSAPRKRIKGFYSDWQKVHLKDICSRVSQKNTNGRCDLVLTIAAKYGLVSQLDFFNKSVASENLEGYYLLQKGDFAYNKSYSSEYTCGAVKRLERYEEGVLSPLYICFRPDPSKVNSDYLSYYFESTKWYREIMDISVEGARNHGLLNISVVDYFNTIHRIPNMDEQKCIANVIKAIMHKISSEQTILDCYVKQRIFLLRQMFI